MLSRLILVLLPVLLLVAWVFRRHIRLEVGPMRYLIMFFGVITLMAGFAVKASAHRPDEDTVEIAVIQLGGILVAIGMATSDIVEAIKRGPDRRIEQLSESGEREGSTTRKG